MSGRRQALALKKNDVAMMLLAKTHLGKANINFQMEEYIHSKRPDGIPIFDVKKIWEKVLLAARVIVAVKNPADVVAVSGNEQCQRAVLKFCTHTGATPIAGRFTPGTLTNQITSSFREPRLLIVSDPIIDHQPIAEASYVAIPTLAFCNTSANLKYIDIAIPCNTENNHSIGLMWWLLAREVKRMRGELKDDKEWAEVMVDLFFYRDPADVERQEQEGPQVHEAEYEPQSWTEGLDGQVKPAAQQTQQWAGPDQNSQADPDWGDQEAAALQPVLTQSFLPTATAPDDHKNWGDDTWTS
ncbi:40S ribosomal protein SA [Oopsacas minuta]|uniref:Small ribosomal subunit protein uS2 n=1 Tax=Oopsacas minuta TaxID=111878 RepID=A0AAV7JWR1_9METZ|nr:40S ribosomal protein SA [Oopsacas minuta]